MEIKIRRSVRQTYRLIELRRPKMSHTLRGGKFSTKVMAVSGRKEGLLNRWCWKMRTQVTDWEDATVRSRQGGL